MALLKNYLSLQQLRAIAALGVVVFHVETQVSRMGYQGYWPNFLSSGVDIFFVISGFIMWVTTYGRSVAPLQFYANRIARIVPLYWLVTTFALAIVLIRPEWMQSGALDWAHTIKSYLFIPSVHPVKTSTMEPLIFAGWTLNYEMVFYAIFGVALLLRPMPRLLATLAALVCLVSIKLFAPAPLSLAWFYSSDIVLEFGFGVLFGWFVTSGRTLPTAISIALIALGAAALAAFAANPAIDLPRVIVRGIPAAAIVIGAICCEINGKVFRSAFVHYLGDASYSIYLVHGIILSAFSQVWRRLVPEAFATNYLMFTVLAIIASCACSILVYEAVEKPIARRLKRKKHEAPIVQMAN